MCNIEGLFRGLPAAHGYDTAEVRKMEDAKVGTMAGQGPCDSRPAGGHGPHRGVLLLPR